jgi:hypothetical protein
VQVVVEVVMRIRRAPLLSVIKEMLVVVLVEEQHITQIHMPIKVVEV